MLYGFVGSQDWRETAHVVIGAYIACVQETVYPSLYFLSRSVIKSTISLSPQNDFEEVCGKLSRGPLIWIQREVFEEKNIFFIFFLYSTIRGETFWKF